MLRPLLNLAPDLAVIINNFSSALFFLDIQPNASEMKPTCFSKNVVIVKMKRIEIISMFIFGLNDISYDFGKLEANLGEKN